MRTAVFTCISVGIVAGILLQMIAPFIPIWMGGAPEVIRWHRLCAHLSDGCALLHPGDGIFAHDAKSWQYENAHDSEYLRQPHQLRSEFPLYL